MMVTTSPTRAAIKAKIQNFRMIYSLCYQYTTPNLPLHMLGRSNQKISHPHGNDSEIGVERLHNDITGVAKSRLPHNRVSKN